MSYRIIDIMQDFTDRETGVRSIMCEIIADTAADLPANTAQRIFIIGTFATVIDTGYQYKIDSGGNWILQPAGEYRNVYTKSEIDNIVSGINDDITDINDTDTLQNAVITDLLNTGGKNHAQTNNGSATRNFRIPLNIPAGDYVLHIGEITSTDTDASVCRIAVANAADNAIFSGGSTRGHDKIIRFSISESAAWLYVYASDNYSHSGGDTVTVANLMVCSQSDYDFSPEYVAYCPTLSEFYTIYTNEISGINDLLGGGFQ